MERVSPILDSFGQAYVHPNGKARPQLDKLTNAQTRLAERFNRIRASYDSASDGDDHVNYWANADALDADSANNRTVRHKLMQRSRYETGSNGFYDGILETHVNMVIGIGPTLRMQTTNRGFNQVVERAFDRWCKAVQFRRKLWCYAHSHYQDGEGIGILQYNPGIRNDVQLDWKLIEPEQCQTPYLPALIEGYIDGIKYDQYDNIEWYDILPKHPGSADAVLMRNLNPIRVDPSNVVHWYKMKRPGSHRGKPALTSTLNAGASHRRFRSATVSAAETAAMHTLMLETMFQPDELEYVEPMSTMNIQNRMMTALPDGYKAYQMKAEHPNTTYNDFNRANISEQARPISMPYNAAACDSSTYSFASGKLDTLSYRAEIDVERKDCEEIACDKIFEMWFREWTIIESLREFPPNHAWDWPAHPIIDEVAHARSNDIKLRNGSMTLRKAYSDVGEDFEDALVNMTEDYFGEVNDQNILAMRQILLKTHYPDAMQPAEQSEDASQMAAQLRQLNQRIAKLEAVSQ